MVVKAAIFFLQKFLTFNEPLKQLKEDWKGKRGGDRKKKKKEI